MMDKITDLSLRAKIAIGIGVYEWLVGRFEHLSQNSEYKKMVEAAWCILINVRYSSWYQPGYDQQYKGPVECPAWYAYVTMLFPTLHVAQNVSDFDYDYEVKDYDYTYTYNQENWICFYNLIAMVLHVLPTDKITVFKSWLEGVIDRLLIHYSEPEQQEGEFDNLFGFADDKDWLGDYIAREALDLSFDYKPENAKNLCEKYLQQVDYENNEYLVSPNELTYGRKAITHPYQKIN